MYLDCISFNYSYKIYKTPQLYIASDEENLSICL